MRSNAPSSPLVSILLPVRNAAPWLDEALASLAAQTMGDFEIVAVDDGSTDESGGILERWKALEPRLRVLRQPHAGIVGALESARRGASGRFVARMDADDIAMPERFEHQLATLLADDTLTAIGCGVRYFPADVVAEGARRYETWLNGLVTPDAIARDVFVECPIAHPTLMIRARRLEALGGYIDRGWPEDYDLVLRLWEAGDRMANLPRVLHRWRERPDRLSRSDDRYSAESFRRCKTHYLKRTLLSGRSEVLVWGAGPTGKRFARALIDAGLGIASFIDLDPRKIGHTIHGAPVVGPDDLPESGGTFCVAAVGQRGAREEIRTALTTSGWRELEQFVVVA